MSATDGLIELIRDSIFETLDTSGRETAEVVAARVVDALKQATDTAAVVGYVVANGQVREIKVIEHEFEDSDSDGPFTTWTFSTFNEESAG